MDSCSKHLRDLTIYDIDLNQTICDRCALFDPTYKSHTFIQTKDLSNYTQLLFTDFTSKLNSLKLQEQNSYITSHVLRQLCLKKISSEVASINQTYSGLIQELQRERDLKIVQLEHRIDSIVEQSKRQINLLISKEYELVVKTSQSLLKLLDQRKYPQICQTIKENKLNKKIQTIQKDLQMIYFQFNNKINYLNSQAPYFLPLNKKPSQKEQMLITHNEVQIIEIVSTSNSLKDSRVSSKTDRTSISFGSMESYPQKSLEVNNKIDVSLKQALNTLKVHNKSEVKNLYIKNSIKSITMTQLDMNNNEALQAIKKCSLNNFVAKIDLSYNNQLTQKLLIHLKRQKISSKYLKNIVIKGIKIDANQLKRQGIQWDHCKGSMLIGNIKIEY